MMAARPKNGGDPGFEAEVAPADSSAISRRFRVTGEEIGSGQIIVREYRLPTTQQNDYLDFFERLAADFGTIVPSNRREAAPSAFAAPYRVLLAENLSSDILYGYGDPAVIRVDDPKSGPTYYLLATSNDAANSFPVIRSADLKHWEMLGFVFPQGQKPCWAADGEHVGDYWAPEMHRVGERYIVCFTAREKNGDLAIGLAMAEHPEGPFTALDRPLLRGGVIDSHILNTANGAYLLWKEDANAAWPGLLTDLLQSHPDIIGRLFPDARAARTAHFVRTVGTWVGSLKPMEQFFVQQVLIEAVTEDFAPFRQRLRQLSEDASFATRDTAARVLDAMRTRIYGQRLSLDDLALTGDRAVVIENDLDWEGHLVEGVWVSEHEGRYHLFYAGNDFSTAQYGIGAAVADAPLGPYRKMAEPLLRSCSDWSGPGHPSLAIGPDGQPLLFLHAFLPGTGGYKIFRALLAVPVSFTESGVELGP